TVGANKNSIKIIGDNTDMYAQGYFQYDSKKSGGITRSHLRFGKNRIQSEYLVVNADFIACHQKAFIGRYDVLEGIKENGVFLINSDWSKEEVFQNLTEDMQKTIIEKKVRLYNIDALKIATKVGLGSRVNTVMQAAFFLISEVLEREEAIKMIKAAIKKSYQKKGMEIVEMNWAAVDAVNAELDQIEVPSALPKGHVTAKQLIADDADEFTKNIIEPIMREKGDDIPVSQMPYDGFVPSGTTKLEKRGVAPAVPHWISDQCIQCNQCAVVCPHAAIRPKLMTEADLEGAPETFNTLNAMGKDKDQYRYKIQVYIEDCQGCRVCVNECPKGALEMKPIEDERAAGENDNQEFFENLPEDVMGSNNPNTVKGSQFKQPLLEFSGACAGCGETPYAKLITQLFGDRMIIANATGCSSIWGGTFPTIPYCQNKVGHGPSWANSLFEDNAEYGLGMKLAVDANRRQLKTNATALLEDNISEDLKDAIQYALANWNGITEEVKNNAARIKELLAKEEKTARLNKVIELQNYFVKKSVWAFGGDGWAYDIGYGGVDHVLASGKDINILVMDTEVYSNTGGQASKASPLGAVAKFAESGKGTIKKDLGMMTMSYGYIYVASIAMGANKAQALKAIKEAEEFDGPSLIMAYSPCINHGIDMSMSQKEEKKAVATGYWINYRYNPALTAEGKNPFILDSKKPTRPACDFLEGEKRYTSLKQTFPEKVQGFCEQFETYATDRYEKYRKMAEEK
ncbi:MAG: pyruvate:ferredoxin (flavodoxin) oxidoreductase, partial [Candidatus Cloacimonadales bacterium]